MNLKLKPLFAALVFAASIPAQASIAPSTSGNGELFLSVWDPVGLTSYTRDLGIFMNDFLPGSVATTAGYSLVSASDSVWSTFIASVSSMSAVRWDVTALDETGSGADQDRYLTTGMAPSTTIDDLSNAQLSSFNVVNNYLGGVNTFGSAPGNSAVNDSIINTVNDGFAYFGSTQKGEKWGNKANFTSTGSLGQSLNFYKLNTTSTSGLAKIAVTQYGYTDPVDGLLAASWAMGSNGVLTYSVPAPATVPVPAAVWLFGSGVLGMIGVARRRQNT